MPRKPKPELSQSPTAVLKPILPLGIGSTVRYYHDGWRTGRIEEIKGKIVKVRPTTMYGRPRLVTLALDELTAI